LPPERVTPSTVRELADGLAYSVILSPVAGLVGIVLLWATTGGSYGVLDLASLGLGELFKRIPIQTVLGVVAYVLGALALAEIVGYTRVFARLRAWFVDLLPGDTGITEPPIWYTVLEDRREEAGFPEAFLNVFLDDDTRYTGVKLLAPIVADDVVDRDFAIWKARHYLKDGTMYELAPDEVVLLNTKHCRAVEVRYVTPEVVPAGGAVKI
jgi:hypothetical protein